MGGGSDEMSAQAARDYGVLQSKLAMIGSEGMVGAEKYASGLYAMGGTDQSAKFSAMSTDVLEAGAGQPITGIGDVANRGMATALGESGVAQQKVLSGVDEINKVRSILANQGLRTTAIGAGAAGRSVEAISLLPRNPGLSTGLAVAGLGASVYGAYANSPGGGSSAQERSYSQNQPLFASDAFYKMGASSGQPLGSSYFSGKPGG